MRFLLDIAQRVDLAGTVVNMPVWAKLFPVGVTKYRPDFPNGKIEFSRDFLASMVANYEAEGKPERAVNYFHNGASGVAAPIADKVAAGWIQALELRDDGLYAQIKWNDRAREFILADELRYLSPEFTTAGRSKATGKPQGPTLLGAALLNDPYLTELPAVAASETAGDTVDRKLICALLGLAETATDAEINTALAERQAKDAAGAAEVAKLTEAKTAAEGSIVKLTEQIAALTERADRAEGEVAKLTADAKATEVKAFFDRLVGEGRCLPAVREGMEKIALSQGIDAVKFLEKLPAVVKPGAEVGVAGGEDSDAKRKAVEVKFNDRMDALIKAGNSVRDAADKARLDLSTEEKTLLFG